MDRKCPKCGESVAEDRDYCPLCGHAFTAAACPDHPDRTASDRCVICGRPVCEACDDAERDGACRCERHADIPVVEGWAQLYTTGSEVDAQLVQQNLQAEGLDARVFSQKDRSFAIGIGDLSPVRLLVPAEQFVGALEILRAHMSPEGEVSFACPECGEPLDADAERCEACGATLP